MTIGVPEHPPIMWPTEYGTQDGIASSEVDDIGIVLDGDVILSSQGVKLRVCAIDLLQVEKEDTSPPKMAKTEMHSKLRVFDFIFVILVVYQLPIQASYLEAYLGRLIFDLQIPFRYCSM